MQTLSNKISEADIEKLRYERYLYPSTMVQKRLEAVLLKCSTRLNNKEIGAICGLHYNSVSHWIRVYIEAGYEGLLTNNYGTNKSELDGYRVSILKELEAAPPLTASEAAIRIFESTGVKRSDQQVRAFMKRHGLKFRKCGHIPAKADNDKQTLWVENTLNPVIEAAKKEELHLFFYDAAHFILQPFISFLWSVSRVFIKGSAGRNRINVLGAVNAITKDIVTLTNTTYITSETLIEFFKDLKSKYGDKPIAIVLDNARYQHCWLVKTFAASIGIHLLFLPPYSPNLNIIERVWKFTKKKILYAKYYDKPQAFHDAIRDFFHNINQLHKEELKSLLSLKFQFFEETKPLIYPL